MLELLITSFPALLRYFQLKRRGEAITVYNMHQAVFLWFVMAALLFLAIFYYHPKSMTGLVPFRTAPVVAQIGGPVTAVHVQNGQRVEKGDLLFTVEDSSQTAAVEKARAKLNEIEAAMIAAQAELDIARGQVMSARGALKETQDDLDVKTKARSKNANTFSRQEIVRLTNIRDSRQGALDAARAGLELAEAQLAYILPARQQSALAARADAENNLSKTRVRAFTSGIASQVTLNEGARASQLAVAPSMLIIPDRDPEMPVRVTAGFSQSANTVIKPGMPAEIACESNFNIAMRGSVLPARVAFKQDAVAAGQLVPSGKLIEPRERAQRGTVLVAFDLVHKDHEKLLLNGSGCMVQLYSSDLEGLGGHVINALGALKALLFRVKVWGALVIGVGLAGGN